MKRRELFLINKVSDSPEDTLNLGRKIALSLAEGSVVALDGCLGSGKTCLVKGIASCLGINENITSATYTIINEYNFSLKNKAPCVFYHIDAYRLSGDMDFANLGGLEIINSQGISVIEWGSRIPESIPEYAIRIFLEITAPSSRKIRIEGIKSL